MSYGAAIIGAGLIGHKRAASLVSTRLVAVADLVPERAEKLAAEYSGATAYSDWLPAINRDDVDIVVVATLHDSLAEITEAAIEAGCHVLVEKPAGRSPAEIATLLAKAQAKAVKVRVGFNHRYHRAVLKAKELVDQGLLGPLMFIRARYGHGGRLGYDREWRADPQLSGGGELLDQGPHLIDLSRWFLGDFEEIHGFAHTYYWDMVVDDNAFMTLKTREKKTAFLHVSCTEWKNMFSFEIYGRDGKIEINGLGGSYGIERISHYRMLPEMGPPDTTIWEFPMADNSWQTEFSDFIDDIEIDREPAAGLSDALEVLRVIEHIYESDLNDNRS